MMFPYRSQNPGVMHACGHDGHTAMLLGAAAALKAKQRQLERNDKNWSFNPPEEASPHGGSQFMIADGIWQTPQVDMMFGLHLWAGSAPMAISASVAAT